MAIFNSTDAIRAVNDAAIQIARLQWFDQETAKQLSPLAEAVANFFMVVFYQADSGSATEEDFQKARDSVQAALLTHKSKTDSISSNVAWMAKFPEPTFLEDDERYSEVPKLVCVANTKDLYNLRLGESLAEALARQRLI